MRLVRDDDTMVLEPEPQSRPEQPDGVVDDAGEDVSSASVEEVDLRLLEAMLFSTHHPLTAGRLAEMLGLETTKPIRAAITQLNQQYIESDRSFRVEQVAGGYQLLTLADFGEA